MQPGSQYLEIGRTTSDPRLMRALLFSVHPFGHWVECPLGPGRTMAPGRRTTSCFLATRQKTCHPGSLGGQYFTLSCCMMGMPVIDSVVSGRSRLVLSLPCFSMSATLSPIDVAIKAPFLTAGLAQLLDQDQPLSGQW
ncbi:hypothetical protein CLAIMM_09687 isoform 2 [Cladophialophora immunda]|nr:hypothetical protein CLAIMM_09687 isoform 2 [Cladophialophora immunda]